MLLQIKNLRTHFFTDAGIVRAVDGVSFSLGRGETLGLVGESGSGKSVMALSLMRLVADPPGRIVGGEMLYQLTETGGSEVTAFHIASSGAASIACHTGAGYTRFGLVGSYAGWATASAGRS